MLSKFYSAGLLALALLFAAPAVSRAQTAKYKCMVQMTSYMGEEAYVVISLINPKGGYEKTLYVLGSDKKWYNTLKDWFAFYKQKRTDISAITGASVAGGDRSVNVIELENSKINAGYKIRFEAAVEDKKYNVKDIEIPLTTESLSAKTEGAGGYIRYVRFSPN
ncbi:DUF2271 domain-containing protein [Pedobacter sp. HMF7056]|uniref:DUF2271 domain-containing protein n=2 Tax=Hufsiella ginkgonis TaxID=2695274 RepID=A0A7K1XUN1_9SPHI|nr:DUF2271 domain-containing protein [Hufsiella ginkgonis]